MNLQSGRVHVLITKVISIAVKTFYKNKYRVYCLHELTI